MAPMEADFALVLGAATVQIHMQIAIKLSISGSMQSNIKKSDQKHNKTLIIKYLNNLKINLGRPKQKNLSIIYMGS